MAVPVPISWEAPMDPSEIKDYVHSFAAEMTATLDTLITSTFILPDDAIAAGLEILTQGMTATGGYIFFQVASGSQANAGFENGLRYRIRHQVETAGGRTLERSIWLTVKQL